MEKDEWDATDDFAAMLKELKDSPEAPLRRLLCTFARIAWEELPDNGQQALVTAEQYADKLDADTCVRLQTELRKELPYLQPPKPAAQTYAVSPVLWALEVSSDNFPSYYSAILSAGCVVEHATANAEKICEIIRANVDYPHGRN